LSHGEIKTDYLERCKILVPGEVEKTCTWRGGEYLYWEMWRILYLERWIILLPREVKNTCVPEEV